MNVYCDCLIMLQDSAREDAPKVKSLWSNEADPFEHSSFIPNPYDGEKQIFFALTEKFLAGDLCFSYRWSSAEPDWWPFPGA